MVNARGRKKRGSASRSLKGRGKLKTFYDTLKVGDACCPADCSACEEACLKERNKGEGLARIVATHAPEVNFHMPMVCNQCGEPNCAEVCPTGALVKDKTDGIVKFTEEKCIGCRLCTLACPYGGINFEPSKRIPWKCDLCGGDPKCVNACKYQVLSLIKSRSVLNYLHIDEEVFSPGSGYCLGCAAELILRFTMKVLGKDTFVFTAPGCGLLMLTGMGLNPGCKIPTHICLMTNALSTLSGLKRYYRKKGEDVKCVAFIGDGCAADIGFQPLSGAAERGENIIVICYDNEAYMNTGIQRSSTTPLFSWTNTSPIGRESKGKLQPPKYMPLIMAFHGIPYVATASIGHPEDYAQKLTKALAVKDGMSYIHVLSPCPPGWRARIHSAIEMCKMAVETNYFPLWEAEMGKFRLTYQVNNPQPIQKFTKMMGRFSHLDEDRLSILQEFVDERLALIKSMIRS
ncbi:thiamine pyrophosphate-dependent enzyme [Chloroflexota bacterium]